MMKLDLKAKTFWNGYLASLPDPADVTRRLYEVFAIGNTSKSADAGAALIQSGVKTATSSLVWDYEASNKPMPELGLAQHRRGWRRRSGMHRRNDGR